MHASLHTVHNGIKKESLDTKLVKSIVRTITFPSFILSYQQLIRTLSTEKSKPLASLQVLCFSVQPDELGAYILSSEIEAKCVQMILTMQEAKKQCFLSVYLLLELGTMGCNYFQNINNICYLPPILGRIVI